MTLDPSPSTLHPRPSSSDGTHQRRPARQRPRLGPHRERVQLRARPGGWQRDTKRLHRERRVVGRRREQHGDVLRVEAPQRREDDGALRAVTQGVFIFALVPIRPRWRGERRSLRTFAGASLRPPLAFNPDTPRRLSTPLLTPFNSTPTFASYGTALSSTRIPTRTCSSACSRRTAGCSRRRAATRRSSCGTWTGSSSSACWRGIRGGCGTACLGAFYTLVPIRPRRRGERRSLRTLPGASLRPPLAFNPRPRRLSTPPDAFELHPDVRSYGTTLSVDAAYLVTASSDTTARLWDCASGEAIRVYSGHHKAAVCCALNDSAVDA